MRSLIASLYILFGDDFNWNTAIFHITDYVFVKTEITFVCVVLIFFKSDILTTAFLSLKLNIIPYISRFYMILRLWQNVLYHSTFSRDY